MPIFVAVMLSLLFAGPASATSGWGCYRPNVDQSDPLNVRAAPSASAAVVASLHADSPFIVALDAPGLAQAELHQVHWAELDVCTPSRLPLGARWCPVTLYGPSTASGWVKRRWLDHSECP